MKNKIAVVGTTFVDCKGFADGKSGKYVPAGRNTGKVQFVHGGVGRNVAANLAWSGSDVLFASTVDDNALGREVLEHLEQIGACVDFVAKEEERGMGLWMVILDEQGEQAASLSHMPELSRLESLLAKRGDELAEQAAYIALEIDLTESIVEKVLELAETYHKPVYALPGNMSIILKRPDFLPRLRGFICNHIEIGRLFQFEAEKLTPESLLEKVIQYGREKQIPSMVVTMGAMGAVYYDDITKEQGCEPAIPTQVTDVSGAGDAFFSGTLHGIVQGQTLSEAVKAGTRLASLTIQTSENTLSDQ